MASDRLTVGGRTMTHMPGRIVIDADVCGGRPHFKGTRIPVYVVLEMLSNEESWEDIHRAYPDLRRKDLSDALDFARELASVPRQSLAVAAV
jgi:uncharacterized protein (DUF433 family)